MKYVFRVILVALILIEGCTPRTKTTEKGTLSFRGEALGLDRLPELAEIDLRLTVGLIRHGFLITKQDNTVAIKQLSPVDLSFEEQNRIQTRYVAPWHIAILPLTNTLLLPLQDARTIEIERWIVASRIKTSPILTLLSEGLQSSLEALSNSTARGYIQSLRYETSLNDIKITLKVVLIPYAGQ